MFRRFATYITAAAFSAATLPPAALACTGISLNANDGAHSRPHARIRHFAPVQCDRHSGRSGISGTLPDGGKSLTYTSRYGMIGANAFGQKIIADGVNDQGLSVGLFYFPGTARR